MTMQVNARALAARAVNLVITQGRSLDDALARDAGVQQRDTALVHEMAYGTIRYYFALSALLSHFLRKPLKPKDGDVYALLLVGAYQLLHMRAATHAAVNETVASAEALGKEWAKGLVNGVLRSMLRAGAEEWRRVIATSADEARFNHPAWLLSILRDDWPDAWESICLANDTRAPMALRVNVRKISRSDYLAKLAGAGIAAQPGAPDSAVVLEAPLAVERLPGFRDGEVSVQDAAAQFAAHLVAPSAGQRVLDACAAPGGKASHLLELADVDLVALDFDAARLQRVHQNFARLGLAGEIVVGDAGTPEKWWDGRPFDRILLDAPCSGTGVIRRHPDIKLLRRPDDIPRLVATQARLLNALWPLLKPGGKLLYATCSILKTENDGQAAAFLAARNDARALPVDLPGGRAQSAGCQVLPGDRGMDGFYYAYLEKQ